MSSTISSTAQIERALSLLGSGVSAEATAAALGVSPSYVSQLLADEDFSEEVVKLRYSRLQAHNIRDGAYDGIEDELLHKLRKSLPLMIRPDQILKAIQVVNGAKRRGQSAPERVDAGATIVQITLPTQIVQNFTSDGNNKIISAGEQSFQTMNSNTLLQRFKNQQKETTQPANQELPTHEQARGSG